MRMEVETVLIPRGAKFMKLRLRTPVVRSDVSHFLLTVK